MRYLPSLAAAFTVSVLALQPALAADGKCEGQPGR